MVPASELDDETISDKHLSLIALTYVGCKLAARVDDYI
jgi:hypothetical protein